MLRATMSGWGTRWDVVRDGVPLTTLHYSGWSGALRFDLDDRSFAVSPGSWRGSRYELHDGDAVVADARGVGRREWVLAQGERRLTVRRASLWSGEQEVVDADGARLGRIGRGNVWFTAVRSDVEGVPDLVGVFLLAVVITGWNLLAASGTAAAAT